MSTHAPMQANLSGQGSIGLTATATLDCRMSLVDTFLRGPQFFAARAKEIEALPPADISDAMQTEHRCCVMAAIMQSSAALEAEAWEVLNHGPSHHLASNGSDQNAAKFLKPLAEIIEKESPLERFFLLLHLLRNQRLDRSIKSWQNAALLVKLRNALTHYESLPNSQVDAKKLCVSLKNLKHPRAPFVHETSPYFPNQCLNAACASWAQKSAMDFLDHFYERLGLPDRFLHLRKP